MTCKAGDKCQNQNFVSRNYPKLVVKATAEKGFGLFAEENILTGSFVIEYVGEIINTSELNTRLQAMKQSKNENHYFMSLVENQIIDAGRMGNEARFINHSCDPNCITEKWLVKNSYRIGLFAIKDIKIVSKNYNYLY